MESAVLVMLALKLGLASCMGVMFGWQPMPDGASKEGGQKIEYIVQIEPELAATLQEGQSIPITSDIPDDIGPIGRIRIVVGRGELPRQKLETRFKPWPVQINGQAMGQAKLSRDGVIETQHRVPPVQASGGGRYNQMAAAAKNEIFPPKDGVSVASNPFGRALQQGAEQAKNLASDLAGKVKQPILPPAEQLFGAGGLNTKNVQNAIGDTTNRLRQDFQRGAQNGVQQATNQAGQRLRDAVDNAGQSARNAVDKFGRALTTPQQSTLRGSQQDHAGHDHSGHDHAGHGHEPTRATGTIFPPKTPAEGLAGKGRRIDTPIQQRQPKRQQPSLGAPTANYAQPDPARTTPRRGLDSYDPPADSRVGIAPPPRYDDRNDDRARRTPDADSGWPRDTGGRDDFDIANGDAGNRSPIYPYRGDTTRGGNYSDRRPPALNTASTGNNDGPSLNYPQNDGSGWPNESSPQTTAPAIRKDMVDSSVDGGFRSTNTNPDYQLPSISYQDDNPQPAGFSGWNSDDETSAFGDGGTGPNNKTVFPLVLSWVLLTSSGVGNAYLLLSYYDVRNKYRGVVHGSPRRRDRYDD